MVLLAAAVAGMAANASPPGTTFSSILSSCLVVSVPRPGISQHGPHSSQEILLAYINHNQNDSTRSFVVICSLPLSLAALLDIERPLQQLSFFCSTNSLTSSPLHHQIAPFKISPAVATPQILHIRRPVVKRRPWPRFLP